jgi:hypothetical protein
VEAKTAHDDGGEEEDGGGEKEEKGEGEIEDVEEAEWRKPASVRLLLPWAVRVRIRRVRISTKYLFGVSMVTQRVLMMYVPCPVLPCAPPSRRRRVENAVAAAAVAAPRPGRLLLLGP